MPVLQRFLLLSVFRKKSFQITEHYVHFSHYRTHYRALFQVKNQCKIFLHILQSIFFFFFFFYLFLFSKEPGKLTWDENFFQRRKSIFASLAAFTISKVIINITFILVSINNIIFNFSLRTGKLFNMKTDFQKSIIIVSSR